MKRKKGLPIKLGAGVNIPEGRGEPKHGKLFITFISDRGVINSGEICSARFCSVARVKRVPFGPSISSMNLDTLLFSLLVIKSVWLLGIPFLSEIHKVEIILLNHSSHTAKSHEKNTG